MGGETLWNSGNEKQTPEIDWAEKKNFDYGGNDITSYSNVSLEYCHDKCEKDDSCVVHNYYSGPEGRNRQPKCWIKRGFSKGTNWNEALNMNSYIKQAKPANAYLIIQDDGDCVLYKGSGPADNQGKLFSFKTGNNTNKELSKNDDWFQARKYGRNYLKSDEFLKKGEYLVSDNGYHTIVVSDKGNLLVGSNYSRCRTYDNEKVGGWWANSVYTIPKSDVKNLGNAFYQSEKGNKFQYPQEAINNGVTYKLAKAGYNSPGNSIRWSFVDNVEQAKAFCNANPEAAGFVYRRYSEYPGVGSNKNVVILKNKNMWPKSIARKDPYYDIYVRDKVLDNNYSCNSQINSNVSSDKFTELTGGGEPKITYDVKEKTAIGGQDLIALEGSSPSECEDYCNNSKECKGYSYNRQDMANGGCWMKTGTENQQPNDDFDSYIKKQAIISGMDGTMNKNKDCSIKSATSQERNILEKKKENLMKVMEEILKDMKGLIKKAKRLNDKSNSTKRSGIDMVYEYENIMNKVNQEKQDLQTLKQQDEDSEYITTAENYKYISYSIIAIMLMIFTFKFIKKKS